MTDGRFRIDVIQANRPARGELSPERRAAIESASLTGAWIVIRIPASGPTSITSAYDDAIAAPEVIAAAVAAEADGAHGIVVNCTADTGVEAAREAVSIPVIGVSEAAFHLAAQLSERFAVLTFAERIARRFRAMATQWGMTDRLASVRSIETPLSRLPDPEALAAELATVATRVIRADGAGAIILGCTDFELAAGPLRANLQGHGLDVPLIKPYEVGLHLAESLVRLGLAQSKLTFPRPDGPAKDR